MRMERFTVVATMPNHREADCDSGGCYECFEWCIRIVESQFPVKVGLEREGWDIPPEAA
jgi:hypothetical protein